MAAPGNIEHATLTIDGRPVEVVELRGEEELSLLFRIEIDCRVRNEDPSPDQLMACPVTITLFDGYGVSRMMTGIIAEAEVLHTDTTDSEAALSIVVRPACYPISLGRDCRVYHDLDIVGIAKVVLADAGMPIRWETNRRYRVREYTVQYREDSWTFLSRLFDEEGIFFWFDHSTGTTTLAIADDSTTAPDLLGGAPVQFEYETGMSAAHEVIVEMAEEAKVTPDKWTIWSFDPKKPKLQVRASTGDGPMEVYHAPGGGYRSPADCERRVEVMSEAAASERDTTSGTTTSVRMFPGLIFMVVDHPLPTLNGRYFLVRTRYRVIQRRRLISDAFDQDERPLECEFKSIKADLPFRSPFDMPAERQAGLQTGQVVGTPGEEVHSDNHGRVRVQHRWDRLGTSDDKGGWWMRVAQRGTASSMLLPRIGWTVLTFNEEGILDEPSVLARIHDGEHLPTYSLPENKSRVVYKTATTPANGTFNEIRYEDKDGLEEMFINASKDMNVVVLKQKVDNVHHDHHHKVGNNHDIAVSQNYQEAIKRDQTVSIGGDEVVKTLDRYKTVTLDETITIGGNRTIKAGVSEDHATEGDRTVNVGAAQLDITLGNLSAQAGKFHLTNVGGAAIKVSGKSISEDAGDVSFQTIGAAKLELVKKRRVLDVGKMFFETVGAGIIMKTNEEYNDKGEISNGWAVGGAMQTIAPTVIIEASEGISINCGTSTLSVTPDGIEIKSDAFDLSEAEHLDALTQAIDHN